MAGQNAIVATKLAEIHAEVAQCQKCVPSPLRARQNLPRSGFPPRGQYIAMVIGAEPGGRSRGRPTPEEYRLRFSPGRGGRNKARLIFQDLQRAGVDWSQLFFTNAVKCPATKRQAQECFTQCRHFLDRQIQALNPRFVVVMGTAARYMGLPPAGANSIKHSTYLGVPTISVRHPQGATVLYRQRVVEVVRERLQTNRTGDLPSNPPMERSGDPGRSSAGR